jgi:hypothetical protein
VVEAGPAPVGGGARGPHGGPAAADGVAELGRAADQILCTTAVEAA